MCDIGNPMLSRFLSPDPFIQAPGLAMSHNRYAYCMNNPFMFTDPSGYWFESWYDWLNPMHYLGATMDFINDNTVELRQQMVEIGVPDFGVAINSAGHTSHYVGDHYVSHNQFGNNYAQIGNDAIADARYQNDFANNYSNELWDYGGKLINKVWNSDFARFCVPDVVYINGSGVLTFIGGGGGDGGLALPLRGEDAGMVYLYGTLKGKAGLHGGASINFGRSNYLGSVDLFDFDTTFKGNSSGIEGDHIIGASISASEYDKYGNILLSIDIGVGPSVGGSVNVGAITYATRLFRIW
ncbi:RHS repeat-associated core domain-containing protein [Saccharicrinis carchari]|uniref:RHS repeat-associated core domain-containing protein n=1 Tax=Saccharicrinis carchari TaxID=1168039 RepID=A0A521BID2_SACCC|nr:RHS repeat-associated core domain-containing protein [Saccharicrinis carchari]SMO46799.1 RHS repeat-associated core domain-containing protein [Saccharicrinis carchari]